MRDSNGIGTYSLLTFLRLGSATSITLLPLNAIISNTLSIEFCFNILFLSSNLYLGSIVTSSPSSSSLLLSSGGIKIFLRVSFPSSRAEFSTSSLFASEDDFSKESALEDEGEGGFGFFFSYSRLMLKALGYAYFISTP